MPNGRGGGGGSRGGGGGGGGGSVDAASVERRFLEMERQLRQLQGARGGSDSGGSRGGGGTRGRGGGGGGGRRGRGASPRAQRDGDGSGDSRPGDWACVACDAFPCFARTRNCFRCGAARPGTSSGANAGAAGARGASLSQGARSGAYLGPRGAGGSRPLLGRGGGAAVATVARAELATCPTRRVAQRTTTTDGEGFQTVATRSGRAAAVAATPPRAAAAAVGGPSSWAAIARRAGTGSDSPPPALVAPTPAAEEEQQDAPAAEDEDRLDVDEEFHDDDSDLDDGDDDHEEEGDACADAEEPSEEPSESDLRRAWDEARDAVRLLEQTSKRVPQELLAQARAQRAAAEERWRAAKTPQPLAKRLRWAEAALTEAVAKQEAHRRELEEFERVTDERRRELQRRAEVDDARTERKREALDILRGEGAPQAIPACERALHIATTGIDTDLGPAIAAVVEKVPEGSPVWLELQAVMATLCNVDGVLRQAMRPGQAQPLRPPPPPQRAQRPAVYDISGAGMPSDAPGADQDGGGGAAAALVSVGPRTPAAVPSTGDSVRASCGGGDLALGKAGRRRGPVGGQGLAETRIEQDWRRRRRWRTSQRRRGAVGRRCGGGQAPTPAAPAAGGGGGRTGSRSGRSGHG